ncbi:uridine kinase family protein [Nocardioides sp. SYSU DS0651]|uniref:uridine kinase family protein n=1 Tax=Nocardioides sp. SYSU DS0651 TaxID=3415955 RepID=UPI003F4B7B59
MASPSDPASVARRVLDETLLRPPTLGEGRLICIDGLAGAGKTSIARELALVEPGAVVIATDEMLEGWRGLPGLAASVEELLRPLTQGRPGRWRRWDWLADGWAEERVVQPSPLLVLEGVGSAGAAYDEWVTFLAWVEAERGLRLARGLARDGEEHREHWLTWLEDEVALHERERTRDRADLIVRTG